MELVRLDELRRVRDRTPIPLADVERNPNALVGRDGRLVPFDTYNLSYRDSLEPTRLASLRQEAASAWRAADLPTGRRLDGDAALSADR